jgi:Cu-Zn family superoxide dismutase
MRGLNASGTLLVAVLAACATTPPVPTAQARISDAQGRLLGTLDLVQAGGTTRVRGALEGVPAGPHAIHVHQTGACAPPFTSAGAHFNPDSVPHGRATPAGGHAGDMPNLAVGADGRVDVDAVVPAPLHGARAILDADGAAIVLHAQADDERTDPAGNAGDRIACGIIEQ